MRSVIYGLVTCVIVIASVTQSGAQESLTKTDGRGPVTVAVTPTPAGNVLRVKVALNTHSVGLDDVALDKAVVLKAADGSDVLATSVDGAMGGGHHRSAVLVFPAPTTPSLRVLVRGVGGVAERMFTWETWPPR